MQKNSYASDIYEKERIEYFKKQADKYLNKWNWWASPDRLKDHTTSEIEDGLFESLDIYSYYCDAIEALSGEKYYKPLRVEEWELRTKTDNN